jgi:ABC-type uncharacterized transport system auxiliary subunit
MIYKFNTFISLKVTLIIIILISFQILTSCINLREDYPDINYYSLSPKATEVSKIKTEGILQVRSFTSSIALTEKRFQVENSKGEIQKLYYYRWNDNFAELFTWLTISKLNLEKYFVGGVVSQNTVQIPNYILEGEILGLEIYNGTNKQDDTSYVKLTLKISLLSYTKNSSDLEMIYSNIYTDKVQRLDNKAETIAPAVNSAANNIIETLAKDILTEINH